MDRRPAVTEADEYGAFVRRVLRAYAARVADFDVEGLAGLAQLAQDVDAAVTLAVANLHQRGGYSWAELGRVLGISRQAAQQRYARRTRNEAPVTSW